MSDFSTSVSLKKSVRPKHAKTIMNIRFERIDNSFNYAIFKFQLDLEGTRKY